MTDERGSVTIWVLGLSILLLLFGGLGLDYWRGLMLQRELAAVADSAAIAGASGIDESVYRESGELILEANRATGLVSAAVDWQSISVVDMDVLVSADLVEVTLVAEFEPLLLGVFVDDDDPFLVRATAGARPVLVP